MTCTTFLKVYSFFFRFSKTMMSTSTSMWATRARATGCTTWTSVTTLRNRISSPVRLTSTSTSTLSNPSRPTRRSLSGTAGSTRTGSTYQKLERRCCKHGVSAVNIKSCKYRKTPKNPDTQKVGRLFYRRVMHAKDADGIANSVDPDQTAPKGQDLSVRRHSIIMVTLSGVFWLV